MAGRRVVDRERHETQQGRDEDEEEEAAQQRGEHPAIVADVLLRDLVADEEDDRLHRGAHAGGHSALAVAAQGQPRHHQHDRRRHDEEDEVLGGLEVHRPHVVVAEPAAVRHVVQQHLGRAVSLRGGSLRARGLHRGQQPDETAHRASGCTAGRDTTAVSRARKATKWLRREITKGTAGRVAERSVTATARRSSAASLVPTI